VILFGYYAFLNLGLFLVAWFRSWRVLNVTGFVFTFVIATVWGVLRYQEAMFSTVEPFLILYFLMYLGISVLFTLRHPYSPGNLVDGTLVFGLPATAFPLQVGLVSGFDHGEAYSALALGILYAGLWRWLKGRVYTALLAHSFLALSVVFFTIAVPYIFDADVSAALWSMEGTAAIWLGLRQNRKITRYFGILMLGVSIVVYHGAQEGSYWISITAYIGYVLIIVSSVTASYLLDRQKEVLPAFDAWMAKIFLGLGIALWFGASLRALPPGYLYHGQDALAVLLFGALLLLVAERFLSWRLLMNVLQGVLPLGVLIFLAGMDTMRIFATHPFEGWGMWILGVLFALHMGMLYLYGSMWRFAVYLHLLGLWFFVLVGSLEIHFHVVQYFHEGIYPLLSFAFVPLLVCIALLVPDTYKGWTEAYRTSYQTSGAGGLLTVLGLWQMYAFTFVCTDTCVALFNLLDMTQVAVLVVMVYWLYRNKSLLTEVEKRRVLIILAILGFMLLTVLFARAVHYFYGVAYHIDTLWQSGYFQTGLSLLWSLTAIILMLLSKRYGHRILWLTGFGLLLVVVLKLFVVELANSGTIARIISFIVVGLLLLLIGYFVPMPPQKDEEGRIAKEA
jgi:uncharacterized membrane protein